MAEYIERSAAVDWFMTFRRIREDSIPTETVIDDLKHTIPAAEVAPIVHCTNCIHSELPVVVGGVERCPLNAMVITDGSYCSLGEKGD